MITLDYTFERRLDLQRKEGWEEGWEEGENALIELYATLKRLGRESDAEKVMTDPETRRRLYRELGIGGSERDDR